MNAEIFGPEILILLFLVIPAIGIWAAIDASAKPEWAFERVGYNKTVWIVLPIIGIFLCGIVTVISAIVWFAAIRPKVVAAVSGGRPRD